ncbi:MAG: hypothetical protein ACOZF0_07715 [Thermodesulfobacteriota bacterium]
MLSRFTLLLAMAVFLLVAGITGCSTTTQLYSVYKDAEYKDGPVKKLLIVGIFDKPAKRKLFEETFVREFKNEGVAAVASSAVMPLDQQITKETLKAKALELGLDTVMVTHLLGVDKDEVYDPSGDQWIPRSYYYGFGTYYTYVTTYVYYPDYYSEHVFVRLETNLYSAATEKLIWSVSSETMDPKTAAEVLEPMCRVLLMNLHDNNLL